MIRLSQTNIIKSKLYKAEKHPTISILSGILAGMFISFGALLMSIAKAEDCNKLICGMMFACGLLFVIITGTELFTGNCMIRGLIFNDKKIDKFNITKLLILSYFSNFLGAVLVFIIVLACGLDYSELADIAVNKCSGNAFNIFAKGFACNILVCLAVWIGVYVEYDGTHTERFIAVLFSVTIFVACGFEHSIANMFILPFGLLSGNIDILQVITQLILVTVGNYCGGFFMGVLINGTTNYF